MNKRIKDHFKTHWIRVAMVCFLVVVHFVLLCTSARVKSPTADEYSYIASSYFYVSDWDFRLDRTHPPLLRLLMGAPLQFLDIELPDLQKELWDSPQANWLGYEIGWDMLLSGKNDWQSILFWARLPIMLLSCGLAVLLFIWARQLYGDAGGFITLWLYAFSPSMLAHARLATMDAGLCFFFVLALFLFYRWYKQPSMGNLVLAGLGLGLALLAKVTALILLPIFIGFQIWTAVQEPEKQKAWKQYIVNNVILFGVMLAAMLAVYGVPFQPFYYWETLQNVVFKSFLGGAEEAAMAGMPHSNYAFYLLGDYSTEGWFYYFWVAILVKTPLAIFLLWIGVLLFGKRWLGPVDILIVGTIGLLLLASTVNRVNIGVRHVLPFYPLVFLWLGRAAWFQRRLLHVFVGVMLVWLCIVSLWIYPDYLPFFNAAAGGPDSGHRILDDSNLDWGQDLARLRTVQLQYPDEPFYIATNWMFRPEAYDIEARRLQEEQIAHPPKGVVAVGKHWAIRHRIHRTSAHYFDWLEKDPPVGQVGHSIWIFHFE